MNLEAARQLSFFMLIFSKLKRKHRFKRELQVQLLQLTLCIFDAY